MNDTPQSSQNGSPERVIILGGGPAGVAAAYWLSAPEQKGRYKVTLYTQGWRLGGKCASGRNKAYADRVEEHGLHVLLGCYQNAFATLRSCYLEWRQHKSDPVNPLQSWTDGFKPQRMVTMMDNDPGYGWTPWNFDFPCFPGEPGDGPLVKGSEQSTLLSEEKMILEMAKRIENVIAQDAPFYAAVVDGFDAMRKLFEGSIELDVAAAALDFAANEARKYVEPHGAEGASDADGEPTIKRELADFDAAIASGRSDLRKIAIFADLGVSIAIGYLLDLFARGEAGYADLDTQDFRAWIGKHGALEVTRNSAVVNVIYDLAFAAVKGAQDSLGSIAAGVGFRVLLEMAAGYRNAPLFRMVAGTADTVFTPLYDVLTERGVDIAFFSRVTEMKTQGEVLSQVTIQPQAKTLHNAPYKPLQRITLASGQQLDSWPNEPLWDQLENAEPLQAANVNFEESHCTTVNGKPDVLKAGEDFDIAISAMPPLALEPLTKDIRATSPQWNSALAESASVCTQAMQLWMDPDLTGLGWPHGSTILTSYALPYDSWGDMSEVLPFENWNNPNVWKGKVPASLGYFCGCLDNQSAIADPQGLGETTNGIAREWAGEHLPGLWPLLNQGDPYDLVVSIYVRYNVDHSEQYVQTPAGQNVASRLDPSKPAAFSNFYAIGDWTKTRFSGGCFESAVESAMVASRAISGFPQDIKTA